MRQLAALLVALCGVAAADTFTFRPSDRDVYDLDHFQLYVWRIGGVNTGGKQVTQASLFFDNIENWNSDPNVLFVDLFDTARWSGLRSFYDDNPNLGTFTDLVDDFFNTRYHNGTDGRGQSATFPIAPGTPGIPLFDRSFGTSPIDYTYYFTSSELATLNAYLADGVFAIGFDPDCHFWNDGVTLKLTTSAPTPTPEPGTIALLGAAALVGLRRLRRSATAKS